LTGEGGADPFEVVAARLAGCRLCAETPAFGGPLPHAPRPIIQGSSGARLCIASQAPGLRAHRSGRPFDDPSGIRLRAWLGLDEARFYDPGCIAIVPMGHCFPGYDPHGGDLPPRRECAGAWRSPVFAALPKLELILAIGLYAQTWHLGADYTGLTNTVARWREILEADRLPRILPLPHPSWRNSGWLKRNPWFEAELVPVLRAEVARLAAPPPQPAVQRIIPTGLGPSDVTGSNRPVAGSRTRSRPVATPK
jgi:uracil-DNA glycosylase